MPLQAPQAPCHHQAAKFQHLESQSWNSAEAVLAAKSGGRTALEHAIKAAELYMKAAEQVLDKAEAARLRQKCQEQIVYAERLKARCASAAPATQSPSTLCASKTSHILLQGSRLHKCEFPPWNQDPTSIEFERNPDNGPEFIDDTVFTLSPTQIENFAAWTKPDELFKTGSNSSQESREHAMMQTSDNTDLVQDITTDCSVVASLSAAYHVLVGKHAVLSSIFYPFDHVEKRPRLSASGKYVIKLNFNGCARRVTIDDRLPSSRTGRALFVVDRHNPCLLWPALLEKAYLKVRGGYDFPGSNSGTDLWVLIGWIPEQIFLQKEYVDIDDLWKRVESAYQSRDVVVTLGTGKISAEEERVMGLIGEHDYAIEAIDSTGGIKRLLIKNPWCDGPVMTKMGWCVPQQACPTSSSPDGSSSNTSLLDGQSSGNRIWVGIEDVAQHFESMYLNWNPSLFSHRRDHHFSWTISSNVYKTSLSQNPQYSIMVANGGTIWILVSRHFVDAELEITRSRRDSSAPHAACRLGFMSILVFDNAGRKVQISGRELYRGPYVDSPQTLARLDTEPGRCYTVVVDQLELPLPEYSFTMSIFSNSRLAFSDATETMSHVSEHNGAWTRRTAGGHSSCATFFQNPQYSLTTTRAGPVSILLSADVNTMHVHVDVVWAQGERVAALLRVKDLVASSGEYRRGCAEVNIPVLEPGTYTLVCSTFDAGQLARFVLRVASMAPVRVAPVPAAEAGRLVTGFPQLRLAEGAMRCRVSLRASWLTKASVTVQTAASSLPPAAATSNGRHPPSAAMVRLSILLGWGPEQVTIAVSGEAEFQDPSVTIRTPQFDIEPQRIQKLGCWILVESMGCSHPGLVLKGDILSDSPIQVGAWEFV
ncbi:hypothetical protein E4U42_000035 [Claviceps africana]|uniref:Calpain catalytic domain-containing protein n=1 Tax=Claviceps africana TaxID=83212 RepID=A0A8K0JDW0_9HYPO|nr:hypothetical protein E4U42_000035 [Claviceps africana]